MDPELTRAMSTGDLIVETNSGSIVGAISVDGVVRSFKGIPFAAPPIGELRWRDPEPPAPWSGVRPATAFANSCIQPAAAPGNSLFAHLFSRTAGEPQSEDCLYLNVWSSAHANERQPVMVWIHGGGFRTGATSNPIYDGEALARRGVVVISINYRLGRFGFFAHPELAKESSHGTSGNYGLLDQIAALKWVQTNASAFGGDPDNVTIFGQSAGAYSVSYLMASPVARGLFARAIGESGAGFGPVQPINEGYTMQSTLDAERAGTSWAASVGATTVADLRRLSAAELLALPAGAGGRLESSWPTVDGYVLPAPPDAVFREGKQNDVPLLAGSNADEGTIFAWLFPPAGTVDGYRSHAENTYGSSAGTNLRLYPANESADVAESSSATFGDRVVGWETWTWARRQAATGKANVYYYYFTTPLPVPSNERFTEGMGSSFRSAHGTEIAYVFQTLPYLGWPYSPKDAHLSDLLSQYWVNFAKNGNPNGKGLPNWPAFDRLSNRPRSSIGNATISGTCFLLYRAHSDSTLPGDVVH